MAELKEPFTFIQRTPAPEPDTPGVELVLHRNLTYQECIAEGCTDAEAFAYWKTCGPPRMAWYATTEEEP